MKKIKVIFTGGTIGSVANQDDISPNENTKYVLLNKYGKNLDRFDICSPLNILSENAFVDDVLKMAQEIKKAESENYEGIIMTHGSDTLAYTSAYLSLLLYDIKIPVVLVASNFVLSDEKANGVINFSAAVDVIDNENTKPGIYITYKNPEDDFVNIHLASRMCEPAPYSDSFHSPENQLYGIWKNNKIELLNTQFERTNKKFNFNVNFKYNILFITPHTGLDYNVYKNNNYKLVLHSMYHSGTANTKDYINNIFDTNLLNYIDYCNEKNIPIYLCNIKKKDVNYNSTNQILKKNINFIYDTLPNVALAKLNIAYNLLDEKNRQEFLNSNIAGEILENRQYI